MSIGLFRDQRRCLLALGETVEGQHMKYKYSLTLSAKYMDQYFARTQLYKQNNVTGKFTFA